MKRSILLYFLLSTLIVFPVKTSAEHDTASHEISILVQPVRICRLNYRSDREYRDGGNIIVEYTFDYEITWISSADKLKNLVIRKSPELPSEINISFRVSRNKGPDIEWVTLTSSDAFVQVYTFEEGLLSCRFTRPETSKYIPSLQDIQIFLNPMDSY